MNPHDELDLLSSYLDEELDAPERTRLETHMSSCEECRTTLTALQATLADIKALAAPAPTPQDSWALRAAIRRARSPMRKWQRLSWAGGAVAAAVIAFAAITLPGDGGSRDLALSTDQAENAVPVFQGGDLDETGAYGRLLSLAGINTGPTPIPSAAMPASGGATGERTTSDSAKVVAPPEAEAFAAYSADAQDRAAIDRCADEARGSTQEFLEPLKYEIATYEGRPAYLLFFRKGDVYELWVMARSSCELLYFAQATA